MDTKYANRVSVLLSNIKAGEILVLGENGVTTSFEVLNKDSVRGPFGHTILTLRNIATGAVTTLNKKEYLKTATCETHSIGYRKARAQAILNPAPVASVAPTAPVAVPADLVSAPAPETPVAAVTAVEVVRAPEPVSSPINAKYSEIGVDVQKELEEVLQLFEAGNTEEAIDRLLN